MDWYPFDGFPKYSISPLGQILHNRTERLVRPYENQWGNVYVTLQQDGHQVNRALGLLVAKAFIPQPNEHFDSVINLNGDRWDCDVRNLAWRPYWFVRKYNRQFRDGYETHIKAPLRARGDDQVYLDSMAVSVAYGVPEIEVALSVMNGTPVWPSYQQFEFA